MVVALYIDPRGPYPTLLGADACWDQSRDATKYEGPQPVVAHPPCGSWGALAHLYKQNDSACGPRAVEQVRLLGGVLEHPARSRLWAACGLPLPGHSDWRGFTIEVEQVSWGHVARKKTWLYLVDIDRELVESTRRTGGTPTHWCSGFRSKRYKSNGGVVPTGIKVCSAQQRRRTPVAFAEWLIMLARSITE